jgi:ureidoglycolate lyase
MATKSKIRSLEIQLLTREAFAPFGDVLETEGAHSFKINNGTTTRFHNLAKVETTGPQARTLISLFRGNAFFLPVTITMVERHPLGSQAFFPLQAERWLVVVAPDENGVPGMPLAFMVEPGKDGLRGVNYHRNTWHHPLIALDVPGDFLVVDRGGEGNNLEEYFYPQAFAIAG